MIDEQALEQLWEEHIRRSKKLAWKGPQLIKSKIASLRIPEILFKLYEPYIGVCEPDYSQVFIVNQLDRYTIQALIKENRACAIHVPGFCSKDVAESLSRQALTEYTNWKLGGIVSTDMFYAGGSIPREVANHSREDFYRYFGERDNFILKQREMALGAWPVDTLRLILDETWPFGAYLGNWLGQKVRPAIMRIMHEKNDFNFSAPELGFIHTDDTPKLKPLWGTFSANIYLNIPEEGGELYIWGINLGCTKGIRSYLQAQLLVMIQEYLFDLEWQKKIVKILPNPFVIKPKVGDLVIIHSGRPHAVAPVKKGIRVTNQLFIRSEGKGPLTIGS